MSSLAINQVCTKTVNSPVGRISFAAFWRGDFVLFLTEMCSNLTFFGAFLRNVRDFWVILSLSLSTSPDPASS